MRGVLVPRLRAGCCLPPRRRRRRAGPGPAAPPRPRPTAARRTGSRFGGSPRSRRSLPRPVATEFAVAPATLDAGVPATFAYRVDGPRARVRVRIVLTAAGAPAPAVRLRLGYLRTGRRHDARLVPGPGSSPPATYASTLQAFDDGRPLAPAHRERVGRAPDRRGSPPPPSPSASRACSRWRAPTRSAATTSASAPAATATSTRARTSAPPRARRSSRPSPATVTGSRSSAGGAGHYVVLRAADGRDYVFMHLQAGRSRVAKGAPLAAGQPFGAGRHHRPLVGPAPALRDLARRLVFVEGLGADRPAPAAPGVGRDALACRALGEIAQLVEHTTENRGVPGSSPGLATREIPIASGFSAFWTGSPSAAIGYPIGSTQA